MAYKHRLEISVPRYKPYIILSIYLEFFKPQVENFQSVIRGFKQQRSCQIFGEFQHANTCTEICLNPESIIRVYGTSKGQIPITSLQH
jgi:hypothetical protein